MPRRDLFSNDFPARTYVFDYKFYIHTYYPLHIVPDYMETFELPESDQHRLRALKEGDEGAFNFIYKEYSLKLYSIAYNSTKSADLAEEIVQEIFVSLWMNRKTLIITRSIKAYLIGAVRNKVFDYVDKQVVRDRHKQLVMKIAHPSHNATQEMIEYQELTIAIDKEIQALPQTTRQVFISSRFEGSNNSEIAKQFCISVKAVEYHVTKALKHLRLQLRHLII